MIYVDRAAGAATIKIPKGRSTIEGATCELILKSTVNLQQRTIAVEDTGEAAPRYYSLAVPAEDMAALAEGEHTYLLTIEGYPVACGILIVTDSTVAGDEEVIQTEMNIEYEQYN